MNIGPFHGGVVHKNITKLHQPLIWEMMLGTVYARCPAEYVRYFDYKYEEAHAFACVDQFYDLRICKNPAKTPSWYGHGKVKIIKNGVEVISEELFCSPKPGQIALWGIPK